MMKRIYLSFLFSCLCILAFAQKTTNKFVTDSLDNYIEKEMKAAGIPGLAICIVKDGEIVVSKGYGISKIGEDKKVDENTLFMIGSNTKAFTGTSVAMLAHEGKCSLTDKVKKWVPEFCFKDKWVEKEANLTDILSHRMGMQTFQGDFLLFGTDLERSEIIKKMGSITPRHEFRTKWGYYNTGFVLAGVAIEKISGMSWNKFFEKNIFSPLEMNNTKALSSEILEVENKAFAHSKADGKTCLIDYCIMDKIGPAGSICSSAKDMSHWLMMQLNWGIYNKKSVISHKIIKATRTPASILGEGRSPFNRSNFRLYSLGWNIEDYEGTKIVSHTGGIPGFLSSMTLIPEHNLGIVVLTNTDKNSLFLSLKMEIIDSYLNLPYRGYAPLYRNSTAKYAKKDELAKQAIRDTADMNIKTELSKKKFIGRYENKLYGFAQINKRKGELIVSFEHHKGLEATLKHMGNNRFLCTFNTPVFGECVVPFKTKGNEVTEFILPLPRELDPLKYKFIKTEK